MFRHECDYNSKDSKIVMLWRTYNVIKEMVLVAIALAVATNVVSCSNKVDQGEIVDINKVPRQVIGGMYAVQTNNGGLQMRLEADLMERFQNDSTNESYELFPEGFKVYAYNEEGLLETHIYSDIAKHTTIKDGEKWEAYGNVVVENYIKGQQLFTDKKDIGDRLAYQALVKTYGYKGIAAESPSYKEMTVEGNKAIVRFDHAEQGFSPWIGIEGFEVAGANKVFYPAKAELGKKNNSLSVFQVVQYGTNNDNQKLTS